MESQPPSSPPYYRLELCPAISQSSADPNVHVPHFPYVGTIYRNNDNAGFDLFMLSDYEFGEKIKCQFIGLGTKARLVCVNGTEETDSHYWLVPRSSLFKRGLMMANSVGIIDSSYRGELKVPTIPLPGTDPTAISIKKGERLFQIVAPDMGWIREIKSVTSLPETQRGCGGFGSTGR